ncbi:MAG: UDP-2,3-diacylglucosamine diphosphatase LpxI [Holosporales bacterium]|nr:UDP-2,3-diacylglucosamine diphosphatase LpxI [Holosporales bacterium]
MKTNLALKTLKKNKSDSSLIPDDGGAAGTIAVVAGSGDLPARVIHQLENIRQPYIVVSIAGDGPPEYPTFGVGEVGAMLEHIRSNHARKVLFCGSIKRPSMFSLHLDTMGKDWLKSLGVRAFLGDDALLKGIRKLLEREGLCVISPQSIVGTLLTPSGILTKTLPCEADLKDIARGIFVLNALSKADVGQAVVVQEGVVLGIEAAEGTKRLIERVLDLKISPKRGGVLVKTSKINQDQLMDIPTIGKNTIMEADHAKLSGVALGASVSQIIDYEGTISLADEKGLFVIGI